MIQTIFITGASTGLGRATALLFAQKGWKVIATMRSPDKETELGKVPGITVMGLDVTNPAQIIETAKAALTDSVLYQRQYRYPQSSGLTIFHNIWGSDNLYPTTLYSQILLFGANAWTDYVDMVINLAP